MSEQAQDAPHFYILADDLIWATRLAGQGRTLGAQVTTLKGVAELRDLLLRGAVGTRDLIAIDTTTRVEEPIALVREAAAAGRVLAVGHHAVHPELVAQFGQQPAQGAASCGPSQPSMP